MGSQNALEQAAASARLFKEPLWITDAASKWVVFGFMVNEILFLEFSLFSFKFSHNPYTCPLDWERNVYNGCGGQTILLKVCLREGY